MLQSKLEKELLIVLGPGFLSMSPASKSSRISTILKYKVLIISFNLMLLTIGY